MAHCCSWLAVAWLIAALMCAQCCSDMPLPTKKGSQKLLPATECTGMHASVLLAPALSLPPLLQSRERVAFDAVEWHVAAGMRALMMYRNLQINMPSHRCMHICKSPKRRPLHVTTFWQAHFSHSNRPAAKHGSPTAANSRHELQSHENGSTKCTAMHAWGHGLGVKLDGTAPAPGPCARQPAAMHTPCRHP